MLPMALLGGRQACIGPATVWRPTDLLTLLLRRSAATAAAGVEKSEAKPITSSPPDAPDSAAAPSLLTGERRIGSYYKLQTNTIPEASASRGLCSGLQEELAATRSQAVMHRRSLVELRSTVQQSGSRTLLRGPAGSGKSLAVASIVEWARSSGWIVLYIPSASALTRGGYFEPRPGPRTLYDTQLSAQQLLRDVVQAHSKQLAGIPSARSRSAEGPTSSSPASTSSLLDVAKRGIKPDSEGSVAVDACLALRDGLARATLSGGPAPDVLFALDDYNSLHWRTDYGRSDEQGNRVLLRVKELTLASQMRLLNESALGNARVLAAVSASRGIPDDNPLACQPGTEEFHMPRYSLAETAHALYWYWESGLIPSKPTKHQVQLLHSLTNGNAKEIRELAPKLQLLASGML